MTDLPRCFFTLLDGWNDPCEYRADGRSDPCHLIDQQRIKHVYSRRGLPCPDLEDERLWVPGCRHHHGIFDRKLRHLELTDFPPKLLAWAQQHHFFWDENRHIWIGEVAIRRAIA